MRPWCVTRIAWLVTQVSSSSWAYAWPNCPAQVNNWQSTLPVWLSFNLLRAMRRSLQCYPNFKCQARRNAHHLDRTISQFSIERNTPALFKFRTEPILLSRANWVCVTYSVGLSAGPDRSEAQDKWWTWVSVGRFWGAASGNDVQTSRQDRFFHHVLIYLITYTTETVFKPTVELRSSKSPLWSSYSNHLLNDYCTPTCLLLQNKVRV